MHRWNTFSLGTVWGRVFCVVFATRAIGGSFSMSFESSLSDNSIAFPDCMGATSLVGDGSCDDRNNNLECGYDGGDCCECTCVSTTHTCGSNLIDCLDPEARYLTMGCDMVPTPCDGDSPQPFVVETTADAYSLADSVFCSGGIFEVEWVGYVAVNRTVYVIDGTVLDLVGRSGAVADGTGKTQLFSVHNGTLRVSDVEMRNGFGTNGGAISAILQSEVAISRVNFSSNTAGGSGGAIYIYDSLLKLADSSTITGNSAVDGGAIYLGGNSICAPDVANGEVYRFIGNNASRGGALFLDNFVTFAVNSPTSSTGTSSYASPSLGSAYSTDSHFSSATNQHTSGSRYFGDSYSAVGATVAHASFINNTARLYGGAIYFGVSSVSWVGETTFEENSAENGGALYMFSTSTIDLQGSTLFAKNHARNDGGAIASGVRAAGSSLTINGTGRFLNNSCGGSGGALAILGSSSVVWGETAPEFAGNSAAGFGGAIYISDASSLFFDGYQFAHARFTENQAQNGGAVFASALTASSSLEFGASSTAFSSAYAGSTPSSSVFFGWQQATVANFSNCIFVENSAVEAGGAIEVVSGLVHVKDTTFVGNYANEGGALKLSGTSELLNSTFSGSRSGEGGGSAISNAGSFSGMVGLRFSANQFVCAATEYVDFTKGSNRFASICQGCDTPCQGCTIADNTSVPTCTTMFDHAGSQDGTATVEGVIVDRGYWRASDQSTSVLSCYNADACLGGLTGHPGFCRDGYEGPYCSVCSEGYATTVANACSKCSDGKGAAIVVVLAIAVLVALGLLWHMVAIEQDGRPQGVVVRVWKVLPLQAIKIVTVAWQIVTQFTSVAHVIYPDTYQRLLDVVAVVNFDISWTLSAGCIMDADFHDGLLVATIWPIGVFALLGITYTVAIHRNRPSEVAVDAVRRKHLGAAVLFTFFIYSSVSSAIFRTFACDEFDDGSVYLRTDYRIECDSPRHRKFMIYAGVMIIVYPVGIPLFYALLLFRDHKITAHGVDNGTRRYYSTSMLREPYRPPVFYYEVVECSRRVLLTGVVVFIYPDSAAQIAVTLLIAFTFVVISEGLSPYASRWDSWVSRTGHVIVFLSVYLALLLRVDVSNERHADQNVFARVLVGAHAIMILLVILETITVLGAMRNQEISLPTRLRTKWKLVRGFPAITGGRRGI